MTSPYDFDTDQGFESDIERESFMIIDYYGILNLPRTGNYSLATEDDIRDSYKRLCRYFHPDKHQSPEAKQLAEDQFIRIQKAYETLLDPEKRKIYDEFGENVLSEVLDNKMGESREVLPDMPFKSDVELTLNATELFSFENNYEFSSPLFNLGVDQLSLRQNYDIPVSANARLQLSGHTLMRGSAGGGNLFTTLHYNFARNAWFEVGGALYRPRPFTFRAGWHPTMNSFSNVQFTTTSMNGLQQLNGALTVGRQVTKTGTGYMAYKIGNWIINPSVFQSIEPGALAIGYNGLGLDGGHLVELQAGLSQSHAVYQYRYKLRGQSNNHRILFKSSLSTYEAMKIAFGGSLQAAEHLKFGYLLEYGSISGLLFRLRFIRGNQRLSIPIVLTKSASWRSLLWSTLAVSLLVEGLEAWLLRPYRKRQRENYIKEYQENHKEVLWRAQQEAQKFISLNRPIAIRLRSEEQKIDGLTVEVAIYGARRKIQQIYDKALSKPKTIDIFEELSKKEKVADVSVAVQLLVISSQINIHGQFSKSQLPGFYDPCMGEKKELLILYTFRGHLHLVTVKDEEPLSCPMRGKFVLQYLTNKYSSSFGLIPMKLRQGSL